MKGTIRSDLAVENQLAERRLYVSWFIFDDWGTH